MHTIKFEGVQGLFNLVEADCSKCYFHNRDMHECNIASEICCLGENITFERIDHQYEFFGIKVILNEDKCSNRFDLCKKCAFYDSKTYGESCYGTPHGDTCDDNGYFVEV